MTAAHRALSDRKTVIEPCDALDEDECGPSQLLYSDPRGINRYT